MLVQKTRLLVKGDFDYECCGFMPGIGPVSDYMYTGTEMCLN